MRTARMGIVTCAVALGLLACAQVPPPERSPANPSPENPTPANPTPAKPSPAMCDLAKVEKGLYCDECKVILQGNMVLDGRFCRECHFDVAPESRTAARNIRVCVKTYYTEATESGNDG